MKRLFVLVALLAVGWKGVAFAEEGEATPLVQGVYPAGGNTWRPINAPNSLSWIHISSAPEVATLASTNNFIPQNSLGIQAWRQRVIINLSTSSTLFLYNNQTDYSTPISSFGIVLASCTSVGINSGGTNMIVLNHQDEIWGIMINQTSGTGGGNGIGGTEQYFSLNRRR